MKKLLLLALVVLGGVMQVNADDYYYSLPGDWDGWNTTVHKFDDNKKVTVTLKAKKTYAFKFYNSQYNGWSGVGEWSIIPENTPWTFDGGNNCGITTTYAGDYTFSFDWDNGSPSISVSYPTGQQYKVHFKNENVGEGSWGSVYCHYFNAEETGNSWPGTELSVGQENYYDVTVSNLYDIIIFNNGSGGENNQTMNISIDYSNSAGEFWVTCNGSKGGDNNYYVTNVSSTAPSGWIGYTRTGLTSGNFGTICLPFAATVTGATVFKIVSKVLDNDDNLTGINLESVDALEAGKAYIFKATGSTLTATYSGSYTPATAGYGMKGNLSSAPETVAAGNYVVGSDNLIHKVVSGGTGVTCGQYKGWITLDGIDEATSRGANFLGFDDESTGIESVEAIEKSESTMYNMQGQRVKDGQKGLFIVNGKKLLRK